MGKHCQGFVGPWLENIYQRLKMSSPASVSLKGIYEFAPGAATKSCVDTR